MNGAGGGQTANVSIISYKPLSDLNFSRCLLHALFSIGVYKPLMEPSLSLLFTIVYSIIQNISAAYVHVLDRFQSKLCVLFIAMMSLYLSFACQEVLAVIEHAPPSSMQPAMTHSCSWNRGSPDFNTALIHDLQLTGYSRLLT